jgi:hypothetical protein
MQIINQLVQFLQQGIAAIFKFIQLVWTWSIGQISQVTQAPWQSWPLWKQVLLVLVLAAVVFRAIQSRQGALGSRRARPCSFRHPARGFRENAPQVVVAGLIALGGLWLINNFNPSAIGVPTAFRSDLR